MSQPRDSLYGVAAAILDGTRIQWEDWQAGDSPEMEALLPEFQALASIASACRSNGTAMWGGLRIDDCVGRGACGEVYRAWDPRLQRRVAVKLIPIDASIADARARAVIEEGRRLARVRHPSVVTIHGVECVDGRIGFCMEFIDGRTLHQRVADGRQRLAPEEVARIGWAVADAVAAVHAEGILHRDIKAQNVMLDRAGRVVLMDFGAGGEQSECRGPLSGTPLYMAPEVLSGRARPTVASDVYSIGVLLYFALTGSCPVTGIDLEAVRAAHERREQRPLQSVRPDVPRWLRRVIARALHPDPPERFETAAALAQALDPRRRARRRVQAVAITAALAMLVGTTAWIVTDSSGPTGSDPALGRAVDTSMRARTLAEREGVADAQRAVQLFEQVLASNPDYAPAHAGLAVAYAHLSMSPYRGVPFDAAHARMRAAADEAVRLDPRLADAHVARGWVYAREFAWRDAEHSFRRAMALAPAGIAAYIGLSYSTLLPLGRTDEALRLVREAAGIDPSATEVRRELGRVLLQAGRAREAVEALEPLRTRPEWNLPLVDVTLGRALVLDGRGADALPLLERVVDPALGPGPWLAWAYVALGRRADAVRLARDYDHLPYRSAIIRAALGDRDRMFEALWAMRRSEPQRLPMLLRAPEFAPFRADPRFVDLLRDLRLEPADHR